MPPEPAAPEQSPEPTIEQRVPPGQTKAPPGRDPDKTAGPKK